MRRSKSIDILRAVAILLVLCNHMESCPREYSRFFHGLAAVLNHGGWIGVDLFFVLSGFLVSGLLFREHQKYGRISGRQFLIRRGFKIYPAFYLFIGITIIEALLAGRRVGLSPCLAEVFFVQNYFPGLWGHTWSLAVEEHFYFLLLIFLLLLAAFAGGPSPFRFVPAGFGVVALSCLAMRTAAWLRFPDSFIAGSHLSHLRIDSLFAGVLISYYYHFHSARFASIFAGKAWCCLLGGGLLLAPAFILPRDSAFMFTLGFVVLYAGSGLLLIGLVAGRPPAGKVAGLLAYVGSHSYSIYLWHWAVEFWIVLPLTRRLGLAGNWLVCVGGFFTFAILFGIVIANAVELPVLRLRDKWFPSRARSLEVGAP